MPSRCQQHPVLSFTAAAALSLAAASAALAADWTMWGGTPSRNMVSEGKNPPTEWDVDTGQNIKWTVRLGSQSYGNPVVAKGLVFVGTNNEAKFDPSYTKDAGIFAIFEEKTGKFLWQNLSPKLAAGPRQRLAVPGDLRQPADRTEHGVVRHQPLRGDRNRPLADAGGREAEGGLEARHDGRAGRLPAQHDQLVDGRARRPALRDHRQRRRRDAQEPARPRGTGDRRDQQDDRKVAWQQNPVGENVLHGQWASPAVAMVEGKPQGRRAARRRVDLRLRRRHRRLGLEVRFEQ
jgi:hypothetical protein